MRRIYMMVWVLVVGCVPIYETHHSYVPPKTTTGMMCINTCEANLSNCRHMAEMKKSNCNYQAELTYRMCMEHKKPEDKNHCYRASCYSEDTHCLADYNRCYQGCGGVISSKQTCVAFCK